MTKLLESLKGMPGMAGMGEPGSDPSPEALLNNLKNGGGECSIF